MTAPRLDDAREFPVDLHVPDRRFGFLTIDDGVVERSTFLDTRIDAPLDHARAVDVDALPALPVPERLGWLFHTSFCGSTLLARALHGGSRTVLREPLVLRRLGDARRSGWPVDGLLVPAVRLLGRPWSPGGFVLVKPTHAALNVGRELLDAAPASRGIVLTSTFDDFLVSNLKKTAETQAKVPELAERALNASPFGTRLPPAALAPPDLLAAVALQWAAQREVCAVLLSHAGGRLRTLAAERLYHAPVDSALATARWLGCDEDAGALRTSARAAASRNAKAVDVAYDAAARARDAAAIAARHAAQLRATRTWFDRHVAPHMTPVAHALEESVPLSFEAA
ncbi:hypothetical protein [Lysobacter xanthus]